MYADIIIDITHEKLDKVFQYRVPEELEGDLRTGAGVIVPFGRGNRETKGYIVGFSETCDYDAEKIKDILRTDTSSVAIEARLVALAAWMKEYYGGTMIQALKTVLPIKRTEQQKEQRILKRCISREAGEKKLEEYLHKNQKARARLMAALLDDEEVEYSLISQKLNITLTVVRALEEQGVLEIKNHKIYRNPVKEKEQQQNRIVAESAAEHGVHGLPEGQPEQHQPQQGGPYDVDEQPAIQNAEKYADDGKPFRSESLRRGNEAEYKHDREHCPCMKIKGWLVRADCEVHP